MSIDLDDRNGRWLEPDWTDDEKVHNWRNHVPDDIKSIWQTFTATQRLVLYNHFEHLASSEEWE